MYYYILTLLDKTSNILILQIFMRVALESDLKLIRRFCGVDFLALFPVASGAYPDCQLSHRGGPRY